MKFELDEFSFQDEINLMNLNNEMQNQQIRPNGTIGFNEDTIYHKIDENNL